MPGLIAAELRVLEHYRPFNLHVTSVLKVSLHCKHAMYIHLPATITLP